jgi:hypothetical protein
MYRMTEFEENSIQIHIESSALYFLWAHTHNLSFLLEENMSLKSSEWSLSLFCFALLCFFAFLVTSLDSIDLFYPPDEM